MSHSTNLLLRKPFFLFLFNTPTPNLRFRTVHSIAHFLASHLYIFESGVSVASSFGGDANSVYMQAICLHGFGFLVMSSLLILCGEASLAFLGLWLECELLLGQFKHLFSTAASQFWGCHLLRSSSAFLSRVFLSVFPFSPHHMDCFLSAFPFSSTQPVCM